MLSVTLGLCFVNVSQFVFLPGYVDLTGICGLRPQNWVEHPDAQYAFSRTGASPVFVDGLWQWEGDTAPQRDKNEDSANCDGGDSCAEFDAEPAKSNPAMWELSLGGPVSSPLVSWLSADETTQRGVIATHTGRIVLLRWDSDEAEIEREWNVPGIVWGPPTIDAQGRMYVGTDADTLHAFALDKPDELWRRRLGSCRYSRAPGPEGARCDVPRGPFVDAARGLYITSADGLYALDSEGAVQWQWPEQVGLSESIWGRMIQASDGSFYVGTRLGRALALHRDGTLRWSYRLGTDVDAAPVEIDGGKICFGSEDGRVSCFTDEGELAWTFSAGGTIFGDLWRSADGGVVVASGDERIYSIRPDGRVAWNRTMSELASHGVLPMDDDSLVALRMGKISEAWILRLTTGEIVSQVELSSTRDDVFSVTQNRELMVTGRSGILRAYQLPHPAPDPAVSESSL